MQITLFSFFAAVTWSSISIAGIYLLRKTHRLTTGFGLWTMIILYLAGIIRVFFPLELPGAIVLGDKHIYPHIYRFLATKHAYGEYLNFSYLTVAFILGVLGICVSLGWYLYHYQKTLQSIKRYATVCGEREYHLLETVNIKTGRAVSITLYSVPNISVPFGIGIFHKAILLPQHNYSDRELYYILLHEYTHFLNRDIPIKVMVTAFCCIFWWNPIVYLLKADLEQTLEMKCDATLIRHMDMLEKAHYMRTIVNVLKRYSITNATPYISTALFHYDSAIDIKERFDIVMKHGTGQPRTLSHALLPLICTFLLALSYMFVPQPVFEVPSTPEANVISFDSSNSYIQLDKQGNYWLCLESERRVQLSDKVANFYKQTGLSIIKE